MPSLLGAVSTSLRLPMKNLFESLLSASDAEQFETLYQTPGVRIERIVSLGHSSPEGFWYDQAQDEFVVLLSGHARLRFDDEEESHEMKPGDWVHIAAHRKHRVDWTSPESPSVWLAVHIHH